MKTLLLIFCFVLLSVSANSNIAVLINNSCTAITQNNNILQKQSFKDFRKEIEINQGHKLKMKDRIKLKLLYHLQHFSEQERKNINRLVVISILFSLTGLLLILAALFIKLYSLIGLVFCVTGLVLSIIVFRKEKKHPGILSKKNTVKTNIAYISGLLGISIAAFLTLLLYIIGIIAGGIAGTIVP